MIQGGRPEPNSELGALYASRRILISAMGLITFGGMTGAMLFHWGNFSQGLDPGFQTRTALLLALTLSILGTALGGRAIFLWLFPLSYVPIIWAIISSSGSNQPWVWLLAGAIYFGCSICLLTPLPLSLAVAIVWPIGAVVLWIVYPKEILPASFAISWGWVGGFQILLTLLATVYAWRFMLREASSTDERYAMDQARAMDITARLERTMVWRSISLRIHETVLNSIRGIVSCEEVDRDQLRAELEKSKPIDSFQSPKVGRTMREILNGLPTDVNSRLHASVDESLAGVELPGNAAASVETLVIELARNARRHGGATEIKLTVSLDNDRLRIVVRDNGSGLGISDKPGFGTTRILDTRVKEAGGASSVIDLPGSGVVVSVTLPLIQVEPEADAPAAGLDGERAMLVTTLSPMEMERVLISTMLAGFLIGGAVIAVYLLLNWPQLALYALGSLFAIGWSAISVLRRRKFGWRVSGLLVVISVLLPMLLPSGPITCLEAGALGPMKLAVAFVLILVAIWGQPLIALFGLIGWLAVTATHELQLPATCRSFDAQVPYQSLMIGAILITLAIFGSKRYQRLHERARKREIDNEQVRVATEAASAAAAHLSNVVGRANDLMERIVAGEPCDEQMRHRLVMVDGQIRAAIQIDPGGRHGFGELCLELVEVAATLGKAITVYALSNSTDVRPVPPEVRECMLAVVAAGPAEGMTMRGVGDGVSEYLSLILPFVDEEVNPLVSGESLTVADATLVCELLESGREGPTQVGFFLHRTSHSSE